MEGLGGPVNVDRYSKAGIDPALEDCCRREVGEKVGWSKDYVCKSCFVSSKINLFKSN